MRTEYEINMDFRRAMAQAEKLRSVVGGMERLSSEELEGALRSVRAGWSGENAEAFLEKANRLERRITDTAGSIRKVAETIEKIARRMRDAELNAIRIAKTGGRGSHSG